MGIVRFLLALSVVIAHSPSAKLFGLPLLDGATAVQCFYVISGFLITMVLNERRGYLSLGNFYLSRFFRLWPAYIVVALAAITVNWHQMFVQLPKVAGWPALAFIWFSNLTLFFQDWLMFLRLDNGALVPTTNYMLWPNMLWLFMPVPQCWSLGVELTFYLIAPFVCRSWQRLTSLFVAALLLRFALTWVVPNADPWVYRFAPTEMVLFAAGGLAYFAGRDLCPRFPRATKIACFVSIAAMAAFIFAERYMLQVTGVWGWMITYLMFLSGPALALMVLVVAPLFYGTKNSRLDGMLGDLSYPMYVCHFLIMKLMVRNDLLTPDSGLYVGAVIVVSAMLFYFVTVPTDRFRRRFGARNPVPSLRIDAPMATALTAIRE